MGFFGDCGSNGVKAILVTWLEATSTTHN